jgi:hypothetical protein
MKRGEAPQKEDFQFYCDPCQKGFHTQVRYQEHLQDHIYCAVPGCHFTCRKSKQWKMEMHVETLHNRPDAPQLQDVDAYLRQRKHRFPTSGTVQSKVEELFYKASRGEVLPDERRRWMRQHGVMIKKKRMRDESSYVSSNADKLESTAPKTATEEDQNTRVIYLEAPVPTKAATSSTEAGAPPAPVRKQRLVPEGPDGRLSKSQKVQLIREKYRESQVVPKFYVCNRCGEKGVHWVAECPMLHDERFERHNEWGEDHRPRRPEAPALEVPGETMAPDDVGSAEAEVVVNEEQAAAPETPPARASSSTGLQAVAEPAPDTEDEGSDAAPMEKGARDSSDISEKREFLKVIQPVAARRLRGMAPSGPKGASRRPDAISREPKPSLFNRLTADEGINDKGLLLQALRFFVARDFFNDVDQ